MKQQNSSISSSKNASSSSLSLNKNDFVPVTEYLKLRQPKFKTLEVDQQNVILFENDKREWFVKFNRNLPDQPQDNAVSTYFDYTLFGVLMKLGVDLPIGDFLVFAERIDIYSQVGWATRTIGNLFFQFYETQDTSFDDALESLQTLGDSHFILYTLNSIPTAVCFIGSEYFPPGMLKGNISDYFLIQIINITN